MVQDNIVAILSYKGQIKWQNNNADYSEWFDDKEVRSLKFDEPGNDADGIMVSYDWIMSIHVNGKLAGAVDIYETKNTIQFINIISTKIITSFTKHMINAILIYAKSKNCIDFIFPIRPYHHMTELLLKYGAEHIHYIDIYESVDKFIDGENFSDSEMIVLFRVKQI